MANPLIAEREDSTKAYSGVPIAESVADTQKAIESGDWASGVMGAVGTGLDALGMALDPFGAIFSAGVGWLIEHVGPVSDALDSLTGDPDEIKAHSETWKNVASELDAINTEMKDLVKADTANWMGDAGDAYRKRSEDTANLIDAAKKAAEGAADGIGTAGEVVGAVRTLVRDIIAELVGHLISWALQVVCTLGIAMAWVVPQVVAEVAKVAARIADITTKLVKAMKALSPLLKKLGDGFGDAKKQLDKIKKDDGKSDGPATTKSASADNKPDGGANNTNQQSTDRSPDNGDSGSGGGGNSGANGPAGTNAAGASRSLGGQQPNPKAPDKLNTCGDPIDVATGQMVMAETDAEFLGEPPLVFERTHFSSYQNGRWFGPSWMSTLDERLEVNEKGVSFAAADGTIQHFPMPMPGEWAISDRGPNRRLLRVEDGGWVIVDPDRGWLVFTPWLAIESITDGLKSRIEFIYDENGTPLEVRHSGGYRIRVETEGGLVTALHSTGAEGDEVPLMRYRYDGRRLVEVINESGRPVRFDYDADGRIIGWTDRNGEWYRYVYDHAGRCIRTDGSGGFLAGALEYDVENRVTYYTDSLGHRTEFHLNEAGQVIKEVDPLGAAVTTEWDADDRLLQRVDELGRVLRNDYDEAGLLIATVNPDGSQRRFEYDELGRPVALIEPDGAVTRREYDENGRLAAVTDPAGATTRFTHDERGNLVAVTDPLGKTSRFELNSAGLVTAIIEPTGATTRYERDRFGRITALADPLGAVERRGWTVSGKLAWKQRSDGVIERYSYDGEGNLREALDELGGVTRYEVGHFDLLTAEVRPDGTRLEFAYDSEMRLTGVTNELGQVWSYEYDPAGNLVREKDFDGRAVTYRRDLAGRVVERVDAAGDSTRLRYDLAGNLVERSTGQVTRNFTYDAVGRLLHVADGTSAVSFQYDAVGRVVAESVDGRTVTSGYDQLGRLIRRRTPSGAESAWEYDSNDQPVVLRTAGRTIRIERDQLGRNVRLSLGSGASVEQTWTAGDQLESQQITAVDGKPVQQRSYAYRADGEITRVKDEITGPRTYVMDRSGRVTSVRASGWTENYAYDQAGNVTEAFWPTRGDQDGVGARSYRGTAVQSAGQVRYVHDSRGRLTQRHHPSGTWHYSWDSEDRLVSVTDPAGAQWRYRYDALGRRVAKERLDGSAVVERVEFAWDGSVLVEQARFDASGGRVTAWDYEPDGFRPLSQRDRVAPGQREWIDERFHLIVTDLLGTPTELIDDQGEIAWIPRTSLWGSAVQESGTPLRFPGQYFDPETGLHYNFHRYYDPVTARYLSPDPVGLDAGPNNYAYVSNPNTWSDPLGLTPCQTDKYGSKSPSTLDEFEERRRNRADHQSKKDRARQARKDLAKHVRDNFGPQKGDKYNAFEKDDRKKNLVDHIFKGHRKEDGKNPSGLHAYTDGKLPDNIKDVRVTKGRVDGVHEIEYRREDLGGKNGDKLVSSETKTSTMFPRHWSQDQVLSYIGASNSNFRGGVNLHGMNPEDLQKRIAMNDKTFGVTSMGKNTAFPNL
ncbi:RHS repeat-associated core domain-containing protein [Saccharopolyspora sp. ID03-671]|uniref:RHS repeat-associated core domain-containing protein n=1 Tax=Saccharopolyspora sp. ID03-671 TaxID=3073066 RepID=UPI00324E1072